MQPGSLGIEAMIQTLQWYVLKKGLDAGLASPQFEPLTLGRPMTWKYRGQVVPRNKVVTVEMDIVEVGRDERGAFAIADAYLWVDSLRIYGATGMGMRVVDRAARPTPTGDRLRPERGRRRARAAPGALVRSLGRKLGA